MISVDHVLKCILNMSCTTIKIINMIINETELIHILFKLMTKSKNVVGLIFMTRNQYFMR